MSGRSAIAIFRADLSRLPRLERFVERFAYCSDDERMRAKIVAGELFDNVVVHGRGVRPPLVAIGLSAEPSFLLTIRYRCSNFGEFARALQETRIGAVGKVAPRYDPSAGIYRGFGLAMCGRLAVSLRAVRGLFWNRVIVVF